MQVICLEEQAFYELVDQVAERLIERRRVSSERWMSAEEVMKLLGIKTTTLQKLRDEGAIRFSQPSKKVILYDRNSIDEYLERHIKPIF